jgi:hypothetical protein
MGRNEHADLEAHFLDGSCHLDGHTPFSIRARHMHKFQFAFVRVSEEISYF